ncbi:hypothetical protein FKW77_007659 [Venturia effusa]|uniref:Uncharacterized protein n=1 Tax=Venturia effusa TaxID=50376 RepID=A0A517LE59_9PEZI|nr:hypothetical protein FKW77_007659 [Venturia effusa]
MVAVPSSTTATPKTMGFVTPRYDDEITRAKNFESISLRYLFERCDKAFTGLNEISQNLGPAVKVELLLSQQLFRSWQGRAVELSISLPVGDWVIAVLGELEWWLAQMVTLVEREDRPEQIEEKNINTGDIYHIDEALREHVHARKCAGRIPLTTVIDMSQEISDSHVRDCVHKIDHVITILQDGTRGRGRVYVVRENKETERKARNKARQEERQEKIRGISNRLSEHIVGRISRLLNWRSGFMDLHDQDQKVDISSGKTRGLLKKFSSGEERL